MSESKFRFEGATAEFDINEVGSDTKDAFIGTFKVKCVLSPLDLVKTGRAYRELLGQVNPHMASQKEQNIAFALSQLRYRVIEAPPWWANKEYDGGHIDENVLVEIVNNAVDASEEFGNKEDERIKELQERLTRSIKNKDIEPESEVDSVEAGDEQDEYVEVEEDGIK